MPRAPRRRPAWAGAAIVLLPTLASAAKPWLTDVTASSGLSFRHHAARTGQWLLPETMGAGGALLDVDADGDLDVLLLDSGPPPGAPRQDGLPRHALLRNESRDGVLRFVPAPAPALPGLAAMGACAGDVDGDGDRDAYVTGLPSGRLLLNAGGRLEEAPGNGGVVDPGWGSSCVLFDADRDGALDLFVAHYVTWSAATERHCGGERRGFRAYCPPDEYPSEQDRLFAGDGRGRFRDVTAASGLQGERGKGLGVVATDLDGDGWTDLYVANDQTASSLWLGSGGGRFRDVGLLAGCALSEEGRTQAGMGVDAGDVDGDLDLDLTKTNFAMETSNLSILMTVRDGIPRYREGIRAAGLGQVTLQPLGFGTIFADLDSDGDQDLFAVNGHLIPHLAELHPGQSQAQEDQLLENLGAATAGAVPAFRDARSAWMPAAAARAVGRGLMAGDLDDDGDLDLVVTRNDGEARLLRNETDPARWLGARLRSSTSAPGAPGALVVLRGGGRALLGVRRTGGGYLTSSDERVLFGLRGAPQAAWTAEVRWTSGRRETFVMPAEGRYVTLHEGKGASVQ